MIRYVRSTFSAAILLLLSVSLALGASVSIGGSGNNYTIQGNGMDGISAIDLTLSYDGTLAPSVSQGGLIAGAMMVPNTNVPGSIKIGIISTKPFSGSGPIATVTFKSGSGNLKLVSTNMINSAGASIATQTGNGDTLTTGGGGGGGGGDSSGGGGGGSSTPPPTYLGTVNMPTTDAQTQTVPKQADTPTPPVETATAATAAKPADQQTAAKADEPKKPEENKQTTYTGVLERFRTYQGEKSPAILVALFAKEVASSISQTPSVAISDGSTSVKITARLSSNDNAPNFFLNGAKLVSLKKDDEAGAWILEALPQANALKASLTILNGNEVIELPLTVAPPLKAATISEADFAAFLKNNNKRDYTDDYIYTANYLARKNAAKPTPKK